MFIERNIVGKFEHFKDKLIFVSGPRQAGKTFIINHKLKPTVTLNLDIAKERLIFKRFPDSIIDWYQTSIGPFPPDLHHAEKPLVFIDEIHKVRGWRNIIKGTYDKTSHAINYVASGSSAFKLRKQDVGDSLAGRAVWLTLFPISFREYVKTMAPQIPLLSPWKGEGLLIDAARNNQKHQAALRGLWDDYYSFGSFPENLVRKDQVFYDQWLDDYLTGMLDRDLKDLHVAKDVERVYQVFQLLLEGLGSTYSLTSLAETLGVSPNTIKSDIRAIKQILWGFDLPVASVAKAKQIRKEKKFYPMDFSLTAYQDPTFEGGRFEATVATVLRRGLFSEIASIRSRLHLGYYRDYSKKEVDFIVQRGSKILLAAECKRKAKQKTVHLKHLLKYTPFESMLIVEEAGVFSKVGDILIVSIELIAPCFE